MVHLTKEISLNLKAVEGLGTLRAILVWGGLSKARAKLAWNFGGLFYNKFTLIFKRNPLYFKSVSPFSFDKNKSNFILRKKSP